MTRDFSWLSRTSLLIGEEALQRLAHAHVMVVGLGGVGSYAAEFIARSGVGKMTIIDGDVVDPTNRNRQLPALATNHGESKALIMAERLKARFRSDSSTFVQGFVSASLLYLTGAMMIVGSIQDGTVGDPHTLYVKSLLDGVASVALASSLGVGVAFSAVAVLIVQGAITLMAGQLLFLRSPAVLDAVAATGGVLILAIGINLLDLKQIRVGNLLPAVFFAIAWAALR